MTDQEIIQGIQSGHEPRNQALAHIYSSSHYRVSVEKVIRNMGGSIVDADDCFNEALIIVDRNLRQDRFMGKSSLLSYYVSIAKWNYLASKRKYSREVNMDKIEPSQLNGATQPTNEESPLDAQKDKIKWIMSKATSKCKELFNLYMQNLDYHQMAEVLGHSNANSTKNALYRCREKLRKSLRTLPNQVSF